MHLVTWNVQWCCGRDGIVSPRRIVEHARAMADFDVLCLQEIAVNYPRLTGDAGHDQVALLQALLPGFELLFGAAVDEWTPGVGRQRFGNVVASRLLVLQVQHHVLPSPPDAGVRSMPRQCTVLTVREPSIGPIRIMTTHLEYYSRVQRVAQATALRQLHIDACAQAAAPPLAGDDGSPYQGKCHTFEAILCGDLNLTASEPGYAEIVQPFPLARADAHRTSGEPGLTSRLCDAWRQLHGSLLQPPTFRVHDARPDVRPTACDLVFVSEGLAPRLRRIWVDKRTQASDHQPVAVELR